VSNIPFGTTKPWKKKVYIKTKIYQNICSKFLENRDTDILFIIDLKQKNILLLF